MSANVTAEINAEIRSWGDLAWLAERYQTQTWIFRGVEDATHTLVPAIGREGARKSINNGDELPFEQAAELDMLARFQREVRPFAELRQRDHLSNDWDLRALAQHHGLKTRFLDWSESPLIAAFFAVESAGFKSQQPVNAALYGVPRPQMISSEVDKWPADQEVVAFYPPHLTRRIPVRRGLFTIHRTPDKPWEPQGLKKWTIPHWACFDLKLALNRAGINRASLFPDVDGLANHINWIYKWGIT